MLPAVVTEGLSFFFPPLCPLCDAVSVLPWGVCMDCETTSEWLEPPWCGACGRPLDAGGESDALCSDCSQHRPLFDHAYSVITYDAPIQRAVTRLKYGRDAVWAASLSQLFVRMVPAPVNPFRYDLVAAVPLHTKRLRWRGFNQAGLLAGHLAGRFGLTHARTLLARHRATEAQAGLDRAGRLENLKAAFCVPRPAMAAGKRILLVDDVMTTGATLEACAAVLKEAGAAQVDAMTIARALPGRAP